MPEGEGHPVQAKLPLKGQGKEAFEPGLTFQLESLNSSWVSSLVSLQQLLTPA